MKKQRAGKIAKYEDFSNENVKNTVIFNDNQPDIIDAGTK